MQVPRILLLHLLWWTSVALACPGFLSFSCFWRQQPSLPWPCPPPLPSFHVSAGTISWNSHPLAIGKGESPKQFYAISLLLGYAHEKAQVPIWASLALGAPIRSLVGWYRPGLWATMLPSPPAKRTLSLKAARAKGQRDREIGWHHLSPCIQLCLWPPCSWTSIFCFSCSALGTFVANESWTTWTWYLLFSPDLTDAKPVPTMCQHVHSLPQFSTSISSTCWSSPLYRERKLGRKSALLES